MKTKRNLTDDLVKYFQYPAFRIGQEEIIQDILDGQDVLGILPTGSGKSLCYQLPAQLLPGTTIVVSPLISLMIDQVRELKANNFKSVIALNSFMTYEERRQVYRNLSHYKLIYVSPELLQRDQLLIELMKINIHLFVIDEAHCISQWGHEFRPDYLRLIDVINKLNNPTVLALTATATREVQKDILATLQRPNMTKHIYPIDRSNLVLTVEQVQHNQEKLARLSEILSTYRVPTIVYFSSRSMTEKVSQQLAKNVNDLRVAHYHGGLDAIDRIAIQQQFMNDQLDVICCTSAFGMGINKQNIRLIIHYHFPAELESYIQEVGRAGRDGLLSIGLVLYAQNDQHIHENMIHNELPNEQTLREVFNTLYRSRQNLSLQEVKQQLVDIIDHNEVHWRFLQYQLEKHGIINEGHIIYDASQYETVYKQIFAHIQTRFQLKVRKLTEMMNWLHEETCFRHHLYAGFQSTYEKVEHCCSLCGFRLANWKPKETNRIDDQEATWEKKLKQLFLIGAYDETR